MSQFRAIVQQYLNDYIAPATSPAGSGREGGFVGNEPPVTPAVFHQRLSDEAKPYQPNGWSLDTAEAADLVALADKVYLSYYSDWAHIPLAGDAPPAVVAWWNEARKGA